MEKFGIILDEKDNQLIVRKLDWKGKAKKYGIRKGDIISSFKIENPDRPNKAVVYPIALIILIIFGYFNYRSKTSRAS